MAPGSNDDLVGRLIELGVICLFVGGWLNHMRELLRVRRVNQLAASRARPHGYALTCSICRTARMQQARKLWDIRGIGVVTRIEPFVLAGCARCVRREGLKRTFNVITHGVWSIGGLIAMR